MATLQLINSERISIWSILRLVFLTGSLDSLIYAYNVGQKSSNSSCALILAFTYIYITIDSM